MGHSDIDNLKRIYERFNARDIDGVLELLSTDVAWANGMHGGHVHGHEAIRHYWTSQWSTVDPHVEPLRFDRAAGDEVVVEVRQVVRDLQGRLLEGATDGLRNRTVLHLFRFRDGRVARFDIREPA